jgi:hypothetical protein
MRHLGSILAGVLLAACATNSPQQRHMQLHYQRVGQVETALIGGDLATARAAAAWIAEHDEVAGLPEAGTPWLAAMRSSAHNVSIATTEVAAANAAALMVKTCGDCHHAVHKGPHIVVNLVPLEASTAMNTHVTRHRWAADRMRDGLIGPSDSAWNVGATVLAEQPIYQADVGMRTGRFAEAEQLAERVMELGRRARATTDGYERASVYGEFLTTCAACHTAVGVPRAGSE